MNPCLFFTSNENQSVHESIRTRPGGIHKSRILCLVSLGQASRYPSEIELVSSSLLLSFTALSVWAAVLFSHSVVSDSLWPHGLQHIRLSFPISRSLLRLMSIESVMPSNRLILCRLLLLLPLIFPSIRESLVFGPNYHYWFSSFFIFRTYLFQTLAIFTFSTK